MINIEIRLFIFFVAKGIEALYSQQKQDLELIVAQIINSLLQNSDLNWRKKGKPIGHSGMIWINTVEIIIKFKGLDLIDRVLAELWREVSNTVQEAVIKTNPKKKKSKKAK